MRIHSLEIEGFGPFKSRQVIPFDRLSEDRLFMLEGPTGAGKSSIIDAIVYALYDKTAQLAAAKAGKGKTTESDAAANRRIRSDFCGFDDKTEVCIEFSNSQGRFRVQRTPPLPKLKRDGTETESETKLLLEFIHPPAQPINSVKEGNLRIREIIGLEVEQFAQLIVLPQGRFASFFQATRDARELILQELFKTFFYKDLAAQIALRRKTFLAQLQEHKNQLTVQATILENLGTKSHGIDWTEFRSVLLSDAEPKDLKLKRVESLVTVLHIDASKLQGELDSASEALTPFLAEKTTIELKLGEITKYENLKLKMQNLEKERSKYDAKEETVKKLTALEPLQQSVQSLGESEKELTKIMAKIPKKFATSTTAELRKLNSEKNTARRALDKELGQLENIEDQKTTLEEKIQTATEVQEAKEELEKLKLKLPSLETAVDKAEKALTDYQKNQTATGATTLAKSLKTGKPCPVCGSTDHPKKAKGPEYDEEFESTLKKKLKKAENELADCKSEIKVQTAAAKRKASPLKPLEQKLSELIKKEKELTKKESLQTALSEEIEEIEGVIDLISSRDSFTKEINKLSEQIKPKLQKYGITNLDELRSFLKQNPESLTKEIQSYRESIASTKGSLSEYKDLPAKDALDKRLSVVKSEVTTLEQRVKDLSNRLSEANRNNKDLLKVKSEISSVLQELESDRKAGEKLIELHKVVEGDLDVNKLGMSLERYVLQEKLELVLERGSELLYQISDGKYEFKVQEEKVKGQRGSEGLGITVLDLHTGKERPAETVSGGETFYASLALALGLAEVIRAERGGLELGTLFIDEGFDSLSEDKLEEVFNVLEKLSSESRIIGIISHVESMKLRIPARLEIRSTKGGPSAMKLSGAFDEAG